MKFKLGDKVRVEKNGSLRANKVGDIGIITEINTSQPPIKVQVDGGQTYANWHYEGDLVLAYSLPVNLTFKNATEHQAVQQFLFDNGCKWVLSGTDIQDYGNDNIQVDTKKILCSWACSSDFPNAPTFTINDLETIKEILNPSKPITELQLNNDHTAIIDPNTETVKVGCQTFTFAKVRELAGKL